MTPDGELRRMIDALRVKLYGRSPSPEDAQESRS